MNARYNKIKYNDIANASGISVSVFLQGCDFHCKNCFNQETWDWNQGKEFTEDTLNSIINGLTANGVKRNLCILGGEPMHDKNFETTKKIVLTAREKISNLKIYIWTGFTFDELTKEKQKFIQENVNTLIDGRFIDELKEYGLKYRGSTNQRILNFLKN